MGQPTVQQTELLACKQILEFAKTFYLNPDNLRAFEAWMKFALFPGVFVGELGMIGFVGFAVKGTMKNAVHQIESMLQYYAYPSQR